MTTASDWALAEELAYRLDRAIDLAHGGPGGIGYRDPYYADQPRIITEQLVELIARHGWQGSRYDPDATWVQRQNAPYECPASKDVAA